MKKLKKIKVIFRVGSSFKFGIKFSEPQRVGVGTSSKLSLKLNRMFCPALFVIKRK